METKYTGDIQEKTLKQRLLNEETSPCVCCRLWGKSSIEGWQPKEEQKTSKKRTDTSRSGNHGSLRRERTIITSSRGDFLFRHYESLDRYIKQYRENYASTCMERDMQDVRPVLGVDVPDPYLPKIASSSVLIERIKIIEALSSYYSTERDVKNICLTGRKANAKESHSVLPLHKPDNTLPQIENSNNNNNSNNDDMYNNNDNQNFGLLPTVNENDENTNFEGKTPVKDTFTTFTERLRRHQDIRDIIRVTSSGNDKPKNVECSPKTRKKTLILPAAKLVCSDSEKSRNDNHFKALFPQISLWTDCDPQRHKKPDRVLETLRIGKKVQISKENSNEELCDEILNLRSLETREGDSSRGGNLCLGKTVRPTTNQKEQKKGKRKKFSSDNALQQLSRTVKSSPREATFIRILGQPRGPAPSAKESNMATSKLEQSDVMADKAKVRQSVSKDNGIPLSYLRRHGRRSFYHVLEARSYKPETRKLGTTVIPN